MVAGAVNNLFRNKEPWQIVVITTGTIVSTIYLYELLNHDECKYFPITFRMTLKRFPPPHRCL